MNKKEFAEYIEPRVEEIEDFIKNNMCDKGLKSDTSQKIALLSALLGFERCINGTVDNDFILRTYLQAKRDHEFNDLGSNKPYAVVKNKYDELGELKEGGMCITYYATEQEADEYIEKFNDSIVIPSWRDL